MLANGLRSVHPGEILREEYLEVLGMPVNVLARCLHVSGRRMNEIVHEKRGVTPGIALRLSRYFGTTPEFWLNLQMRYELGKVDDEKGEWIRKITIPFDR